MYFSIAQLFALGTMFSFNAAYILRRDTDWNADVDATLTNGCSASQIACYNQHNMVSCGATDYACMCTNLGYAISCLADCNNGNNAYIARQQQIVDCTAASLYESETEQGNAGATPTMTATTTDSDSDKGATTIPKGSTTTVPTASKTLSKFTSTITAGNILTTLTGTAVKSYALSRADAMGSLVAVMVAIVVAGIHIVA